MKAILWLVPVAVAAGVVYWLVQSNQTARELRTEMNETRKQVETAMNKQVRSGGENPAEVSGTKAGTGPVVSGKNVDWRAVSVMLEEVANGGDGAHIERMFESLDKQLGAMDQAALHAALDQIAGLGLSDEKRSELEAMIVERLMTKDPEGVLSRFDDRIGNDDDDVGWILSEALGQLAEKDPLAAQRWLDAKIKEGKFVSKSLDGYSEARMEYESVLMSRLIGAQGAEAINRVKALPEGDRLGVLEQMDLTALSPAAQKVYAEMVRTLVPESERKGAFGYVASELVYEGGYEAVSAFLDQVDATPDERAEAAGEAASGKLVAITEEGKLTSADVDTLRNWLKSQSVGDVERVVGESIAMATDEEGYFRFEDARKLVLSLHEKSGADEILAGFITNFAGQDQAGEAAKLLNLIKDAELRQKLTQELEP